VTTVLYRTLTFNECTEAAEELQRQIKEARADLTKKGMKFD
jgi:dolichyl-phosphate mannosyltransferase polypeptide 3